MWYRAARCRTTTTKIARARHDDPYREAPLRVHALRLLRMIDLVAIAFLVTAASIVVHAIGTTAWLRFLVGRYSGADGQFLPRTRLGVLIGTAVVLIMLHVVEIFLWAVTYMLVAPGELGSAEAAVYFSAVTFTTLGYGDLTLSSQWRLLSGFEAIDGILLIGWTTAFLFAVLQRSWASPATAGNHSEGLKP